jgi:CRP-like cAMP-binding protein
MWLFSACNRKELALLERACDEIDVIEGTVLCEEGKRGSEFFLILEGEVVVEKNGTEITRLKNGDFFGELALLDHEPRSATVRATTPCKLLVLTSREFVSVLEDIPMMAIRLLEATAHRLREADQRIGL